MNTEGKGLFLLPPSPYVCKFCAVDHNPREPHNARSLFYGMRFIMQHKREGTWADAVAHCDPKLAALWKEAIIDAGANWSEPADGAEPIAELWDGPPNN